MATEAHERKGAFPIIREGGWEAILNMRGRVLQSVMENVF